MLKRIKRAWKGLTGEENKPIYAIKRNSMPSTQIANLAEKTGAVILTLDNIDDFKRVDKSELEGDGTAEFLGEGTEAEFIQQEREDNGTAPWYKRIFRDE